MQTKYRAMSLRTRLGSVLARKSLGSSTHNRRIIHTIRRDTINIASSTRSLAPEGWKASNDVTSSTRSHHSHYHLYCHRHRHISNANDDNNGQKNKDSCDTDGDESNGIYFQLNHNHRNAQNFNNRTFTRHFNFPTPLSHSPLPKTAKTELTGAKSSFRAFISSSASASASATEQTSSPPHNNPISDTEKEEIITHFAMGLRNLVKNSAESQVYAPIPASRNHPLDSNESLMEIARLYETMPHMGKIPAYWGSLFLGMCFEYELYLAMNQHRLTPEGMLQGEPQDSPFLRAIAKLAIRCSENFLLGFYEPYFHQQSLAHLGVLPAFKNLFPKLPKKAKQVTPFTLFTTPGLAERIEPALEQMNDCKKGYAVIDDFFGPVQSRALIDEAQKLGMKSSTDRFMEGELDETKRSDGNTRDDRITWLHGSEMETPLLAALSQYFPSILSQAVGRRVPELHLVHPKCMMGKAMFSAYDQGSKVGFTPHTDNSGIDDSRALTVVYYLNEHWREEDGGQLVLYPEGKAEVVDDDADNGERTRVEIEPCADRMVLFWSKTVPHQVLPTSDAAPKRLAMSFWMLNDTTQSSSVYQSVLDEE